MAGIQLIGASGQPKAPPAGGGRIDPSSLGQQITSWNPTPEQLAATRAKAQQAADMAAATAKTKSAGATGFWGRIQAAGKGAVNFGQTMVTPIARVLPGGQNDLKEENNNIDQNIKSNQQASKMIQSGDPRQVTAGKKLLAMNKQNQADTTAEVGQTAKNISAPGKTVKDFLTGVTAGESAVAKPIARLLPGGQNDLKNENQAIDANIAQMRQANRMIQSGDPKQVIAGKKLLAANKQNMADTSSSVQATSKDIKENTNKGRILAGAGATVADILTGGGGELATQGAKYTAEKGVQKIATGRVVKKISEDQLINAGKKGTATLAVGGATASGANAAASGGDRKQVLEAAAGGLLLPAAGGAARLFKDGSAAALEKVKSLGSKAEPPAPGAMHDIMDAATADKAAATAHTKIGVSDESNAPAKVGVTTPVRPGVKQVSETSQINVRTPQKMSDEDFHAQFNKLSSQYDQESKQLEKAAKILPPKTVEVRSQVLDAKYQAKVNALQDAYHNPELSAPKAPKTIARETLPAGKTTGGLSVARSQKAPATVPDGAVVHTNEGKVTVAKDTTPRDTFGTPSGTPSGNRTAGSAKNLETRAIEKKLLQRSDDLPEYHTLNMKEQAQRSAELISNEPSRAMSIATGREGAPSGLHPMSVLKALEHKASKEGDGETLRQLSMSPLHVNASQSAQTLRTLAEKDPDSPLGAMKAVADKRAATFEKRAGKSADKAITEEAQKSLRQVNSNIKAPTKDEWKVFLESIKC